MNRGQRSDLTLNPSRSVTLGPCEGCIGKCVCDVISRYVARDKGRRRVIVKLRTICDMYCKMLDCYIFVRGNENETDNTIWYVFY